MKKIAVMFLFFVFFINTTQAQTQEPKPYNCNCRLNDILPSLNFIKKITKANPGEVKLVVFETRIQESETTLKLEELGFKKEKVVTPIDERTSFFFYTSEMGKNIIYQEKNSFANQLNPCWIKPWPPRERVLVTEIKNEIVTTNTKPKEYDALIPKCFYEDLKPHLGEILKISKKHPGEIEIVVFASQNAENPNIEEMKKMGFYTREIFYPAQNTKKILVCTNTSERGYKEIKEKENLNCWPKIWKTTGKTTLKITQKAISGDCIHCN